jgi:GNAT superfamily N-acetyltransferase
MAAESRAVRPASHDDAPELARLAAELGYPMPTDEMRRRLGALLSSDRHHVAVVEGEPPRLLGFVHVEHRTSLEGGDRAELMGLVVDARARRQGLGRRLLAAAEEWAGQRALAALTVRSNVARTSSHPFYAAQGYALSKTQHVYSRAIEPVAAPEPQEGVP